MTEKKRLVLGSAAVLMRPDKKVLLAKRPEGKPYAGYWEFPGGKIEPGETPAQAIIREMKEELDINIPVDVPQFIMDFEQDNPDHFLKLTFFLIPQWKNDPRPCEGQEITWTSIDEVDNYKRLPATLAPIRSAVLAGKVETL